MDKKQLLLVNMHTFSIAAKFLSFTKASEELCLTPSAVSHRIKNLESQLGFKLFVRFTRKLELSPEGARLLVTFNSSFEEIFSHIEDLKFNELRGELYIGLSPTFAQSWLLVRLPKFQDLYPNLNIKLRVKASKLDFQNEPVDLAIYYTDKVHPDFISNRLFEEELTPVCTPSYAKKIGLTSDINSMKNATFIHCTEAIETISSSYEWEKWLANMNCYMDVTKSQYEFNHANMAYIAATQSIGIAMARKSLVLEQLKKNELIAPFSSIKSGLGYDLICPKGQEQRPRYLAFLNWIKALDFSLNTDTGI